MVCCGCVLNTKLLSQWWHVCCETFRVNTVQQAVAVCWKLNSYHSDNISVVRHSGSKQYSVLWLSAENQTLITVMTCLLWDIQGQYSTVFCGCLLKIGFLSQWQHFCCRMVRVKTVQCVVSLLKTRLLSQRQHVCCRTVRDHEVHCDVALLKTRLITETTFLLQDGRGPWSTQWCGCLLKTRLLSQWHFCCRTVRDHEVHCAVAASALPATLCLPGGSSSDTFHCIHPLHLCLRQQDTQKVIFRVYMMISLSSCSTHTKI